VLVGSGPGPGPALAVASEPALPGAPFAPVTVTVSAYAVVTSAKDAKDNHRSKKHIHSRLCGSSFPMFVVQMAQSGM
jgi:hypothetical protein